LAVSLETFTSGFDGKGGKSVNKWEKSVFIGGLPSSKNGKKVGNVFGSFTRKGLAVS